MRKIFYLLVFFTVYCNSQTISIPDANFKSKLISLGVDTSGDSNIQLTEALAVTSLDLSNSGISDLTGIENFTNLAVLNCYANSVTSLNSNTLTNLVTLNVVNNLLTTIDVSNLNNLSSLSLGGNALGSINLSNLTNLTYLECQGSLLTSLNLNGLVNLEDVECSANQLTSLDVSGLVNLKRLSCNQNAISFLDVHELVNLEVLDCSSNQLTSINVNGLVHLTQLFCSQNQISTLDLSGLVNLTFIQCYDNLITTLDVSFIPGLTELNCELNHLTTLNIGSLNNLNNLYVYSNQLTSLDVSDLPNLWNLTCSNNLLTTLDLSSNYLLTSVLCENNLLQTLYLKNGSNEVQINFSNNPSLTFICADDFQVASIQSILNTLGMNTTVCNSYCSFTPGGNYNSIHGLITNDLDNNGCDSSDLPQPNIKITINDGSTEGTTFTNNLGEYNFFTQGGTFEVTPNIENGAWFTLSPLTVTIPFANNLNNTTTQNFCITPIGIHSDVEIVIAPIAPARPGFDAIYKIVYKNKGNQIMNGSLNFNFDNTLMDFIDASVFPDSQATGILTWNFSGLLPFESRSITITLNVNSPTETPAVNIGDELSFDVAIAIPQSDEVPEDNVFTLNQFVVGSFDPNDITCLEGAVVDTSEIGNYLHYAVNFENTGTAAAENIVIRTNIDVTKFDVNSLQVLNTSHNAYIRQNGNIVEFIFRHIYLDTGGHGTVLLKIKTNNDLLEGDVVEKNAAIFFDYNFPVDTGFATTTFQSLSATVIEVDASVVIYPNPANDVVRIKCNSNLKSIQLYDVQGRLLLTQLVDSMESLLNISNKSKGIYFLRIVSDKGSKIEKLVKG